MNKRKAHKPNDWDILLRQVRDNKEGLIKRLSRLTIIDNPATVTPCRIWAGPADANGYARLQFRIPGYGRKRGESGQRMCVGVHRLFWMLINRKPIPPDMEVGHLTDCHTPLCVSHVELATRSENLRERDERQK